MSEGSVNPGTNSVIKMTIKTIKITSARPARGEPSGMVNGRALAIANETMPRIPDHPTNAPSRKICRHWVAGVRTAESLDIGNTSTGVDPDHTDDKHGSGDDESIACVGKQLLLCHHACDRPQLQSDDDEDKAI